MPLIIWMDDGLIEHYDIAYPVLESFGFKAVDSIITGYLGNVWPDEGYRDKPCFTLEQAKELRDSGWDIVSHSVTHPHFPLISESEALSEIRNSRDFMVMHGFEDRVFVWPFGEVKYEDIALQHYLYERKTVPEATWDGQNRVVQVTISASHESDILWCVNYAIEQARNNIAILLLHGIRNIDEPRDPWELTPEDFSFLVNQIASSNVEVKTFSECLKVCPQTRFELVNQVLCRIQQRRLNVQSRVWQWL